MATLASQAIVRSGLAPSYAACSVGGDVFTPDSETVLHVKNTSGGALTVTIATPGEAFPGTAIADTVVSIPATTGDKMIGPFPAQYYADPTTGLASITYSGVTNLTIAAVKVQQP